MPSASAYRCEGRRAAFTLVELLVVVSIIGVLVALLLPAVQAAREAARRNGCVNQLRQQALGLLAYHSQNGLFPPGGRLHKTPQQPGVSWRVLVLPFLEEKVLYDVIAPDRDGGAQNWSPQSQMPDVFRCPSDDPAVSSSLVLHESSYWGVAGAARAEGGLDLEDFLCGDLDSNGVLYPGSKTRIAMIEDGTSHTLALGERTYRFRDWMVGAMAAGDPPFLVCSEASNQFRYPINADLQKWGYFIGHTPLPPGGEAKMLLNNLPFGSHHPGGANFAMADGSVHFVPESIDFTLLGDLATVAGGEVTQFP